MEVPGEFVEADLEGLDMDIERKNDAILVDEVELQVAAEECVSRPKSACYGCGGRVRVGVSGCGGSGGGGVEVTMEWWRLTTLRRRR